MRINKNNDRILSTGFRVFTAFTFFILFLSIVSALFPTVAGLSDKYIAMPIRVTVSAISGGFPFPLFEILLLSAPILLVFLCFFIRRLNVKRAAMLCVFLLEGLIILYSVSLSIPSSISDKKLHGSADITENSYISAFSALVAELNDHPPDREEPFDKINERVRFAVSDYAQRHSLVYFDPAVKLSVMPELLTAAGILAHYSFISGEITLNGLQPYYMQGFTVAHEAAHFLGITKEDEANLFAFAALFESESSDLRYFAALRGFEYLAAPIYSISKEIYNSALDSLSASVKSDLASSRAFSENLGTGFLGKVSAGANDAAISLRDGRGSLSYSGTAALIAEYLTEPDK